MDRNMHARRVSAVLIWIAIDREIEEIRANPAVVQQRISFTRRAIAAQLSALLLALNQERKQITLGAMHLRRKRRVILQVLTSDLAFVR